MDLSTPTSSLPGVGPAYAQRLTKLEINTLEDLIYHIPFRYDDYSEINKIAQFPVGSIATIRGEVLEFQNFYTKQGRKIQVAQIYDGTGKIAAVWFNQPFLANSIKPGIKLSLSGQLSWWKKQKALYSPDYEIFSEDANQIHTGRLVPVYPATSGVSPKWLRSRINRVLQDITELEDILPELVRTSHDLDPVIDALKNIHFPQTQQEASRARKRLAFDELIWVHIQSIHRRLEWEKNQAAHKLNTHNFSKQLTDFINQLPFTLTDSQQRSINEILLDLGKGVPMNRLLEGDVGSGKTVVAASASLLSFLNHKRSIFMAPTQILAEQHYQSLQKLYSNFPIKIALLTSSIKTRIDDADIIVGTHAVLYEKSELSDTALVVIDEQHRFGVTQRASLIHKTHLGSIAPHVLTMTATPIPRTIALTLYGDLELSTLDELPKGRLPIKTWIVPDSKRKGAYEWIRNQIKQEQSQVYVVCPLIEESENDSMLEVRAAKSEFQKLHKFFPDMKLGLLHGKLSAKDKNAVLDEFRDGKIQILVTTPVIEVGVDVPAATIMLVEAADRFGLAQLHQLRGRVGRSDKQSYCLLFTHNDNEKTIKRLSALKETHSGFRLAEIDLEQRGPGEVLGTRQHGYSELKIASWQDFDLIKKARSVAQDAMDNPAGYPILHKRFKQKIITDN